METKGNAPVVLARVCFNVLRFDLTTEAWVNVCRSYDREMAAFTSWLWLCAGDVVAIDVAREVESLAAVSA